MGNTDYKRANYKRAWTGSFLIHVIVLAIFYPSIFNLDRLSDALDIALLGSRGGVSWAETIGLTSSGGKTGTEEKARQDEGERLRVEIVVLANNGNDIFSKNKPLDSSGAKAREAQTTPADLGKQAQKKKRKVPKAENEKLSSAPASAEAAARAGKSRNETIGKDIAGTRGAGGADKDAQGQFISGKEVKKLLTGWTFIGTNGFADGSISNDTRHQRRKVRWEVYYHSDGSLDARFFKSASVRPHGELSIREFYSSGRWWIKGNWLCQSISKWFYGGEVCFEVRRKKNKFMALYYASCWGVSRCYEGRLGPQGAIYEGDRIN